MVTGQRNALSCGGTDYLDQFERALEGLLKKINTDFADAVSAFGRLDLSNIKSQMADVTFTLQLASEEFALGIKHIILACGVADAVEVYRASEFTPMPGAERLVNLREHLDPMNSVDAALLEQCTTVPFVEALTTYSSRIHELGNMDVSTLALLIRYYGASLDYSETVDAAREECVQRARDVIATAVAKLTSTPEPSDTDHCEWQEPYRNALDDFMMRVNMVDADSPDAPRKVRDYTTNLAASLDDIRERCGLP